MHLFCCVGTYYRTCIIISRVLKSYVSNVMFLFYASHNTVIVKTTFKSFGICCKIKVNRSWDFIF